MEDIDGAPKQSRQERFVNVVRHVKMIQIVDISLFSYVEWKFTKQR